MASNIEVQGRPLDYGDIAILLRSANRVGGVYRRVLINHGIPVQSGQGGDYYTSIEVSTALSLLSIIDNPHQDIPLIAALRSPVFGFTADELSAVRAADPDADYEEIAEKVGEQIMEKAMRGMSVGGLRIG